MFSSRVSVEPQYGQRNAVRCSWTSVGAVASRGAGGAKPAARSFSRPAGRDPVGRPRVVEDRPRPPARRRARAIASPPSASRITSSAGQPRNVGVNSTRTRSPSTRTSRTTPRSTSEMTGISGSGDLGRAPPRPASAGHHVAPRDGAAHHRHLVPELARARRRARRARPARAGAELEAAPASSAAQLRLERRRARTATAPRAPRGSAARRAGGRPTSPRACGGRPPRGRSSRRARRPPRRRSAFSALEPHLVGGLVEDAPRDRPRPVGHEAQLDERRAAVLVRRAVERERVGVVASSSS